MSKRYLFTALLICIFISASAQQRVSNFDKGWRFNLGEVSDAQETSYNDNSWRQLSLPHDWSIEGKFDKDNPSTQSGGALPGGIGWYRKTFSLPLSEKNKNIFIDFDGVYRNSKVWINGHYLGVRPNGYISFRYDLTPYLKFGNEKNIIAVRVDNSDQPNSRWYSGSGIYRNVWLVKTNKIFVDHWGTYITTPQVSEQLVTVHIQTVINNSSSNQIKKITLENIIYNEQGNQVTKKTSEITANGKIISGSEDFSITNPILWSIEHPYLYKAVTKIIVDGKVEDEYSTTFGIRYFDFDADKGFLLNGKHIKIFGVCDHHDLGCFGTAINKRALERQLEILKSMGINGIRTSHNPPAPELLDLCDKMGFIVMDEAFDMWKKPKSKYDYHLYWDEWHKKDLEDQILRDRNHPSIFIWSIGNEIPEQWAGKNGEDSSGTVIARELANIVKSLDATRPITSALDHPDPKNAIYVSGILDLVGFNYHHQLFGDFQKNFPGKKFICTESVSALETRGHYDMPSDSIRRWPERWDKPFKEGNPDLTCSSYDNCSAPWGSTHEETMKALLKYDFASGMFIWTGFDYIGEPTPYPWPARSSYFGIVDLAGFPKDSYYLYQSICTDKPVLHIFPHWNWKAGDTVDVWAYYNHADEVELFLNGKSLGAKKKMGDDLHVWWRVVYEPGVLKAVSRKDGKVVLTKEIKTAGKPAKIILTADRKNIKAGGSDLSFVTVKIVDANGNAVPDADNDVQFSVTGNGAIAGVDNGSETSMESFKANHRKAFNGLCLVVVRSNETAGAINISASLNGLSSSSIIVNSSN
ncbi:MAG TPA: beta-galactosidase GalB [Puia sp.]|nr:beta-galactosidase GalB [Puia sp.]